MLTTSAIPQEESLSPRALQNLRTTSRWVRFFGVLCFIYSAFSTIGLIGAIVGFFSYSEGGSGSPLSPLVIVALLITVFLIALVAISFYISFVLFDYGLQTSKFVKTDDYTLLAKAFARQLTYWKWIGVMLTITLVFYLLYFIFGVTLGSREAFW